MDRIGNEFVQMNASFNGVEFYHGNFYTSFLRELIVSDCTLHNSSGQIIANSIMRVNNNVFELQSMV